VAAACGERVTVIETGQGEGDRLELRCHPLVPDEKERRVKEILDRIPENHKRGLRRITLHVKQPPQTEGGGGTAGQRAADYTRDEKAIGHYHPNEVASIKHEIGHHVYFDRLNAAARRRWERFFERNRAAMPTEYARTEAKEGFAEVYEFYYDRKDLDPAVKAEFETIIALVP
jgi:DNA repair photolyase